MAERYPAVRALRDVTVEMLNNCENRLSLVVYKRCLHVITENERVLKSIQALKAGDLVAFGELINQSHDSLRDFYEVSCEEVDLLVELARRFRGFGRQNHRRVLADVRQFNQSDAVGFHRLCIV